MLRQLFRIVQLLPSDYIINRLEWKEEKIILHHLESSKNAKLTDKMLSYNR